MTVRRTLSGAVRCGAVLGLGVLAGVSACGASADDDPAASSTQQSQGESSHRFPDVTKVEVTGSADSRDFAATISSPYDTPERYADGIRVRSADRDTVYAMTELGHDHASEQPFTRSVTGVEIPEDVDSVVVEGRDQDNGWGGRTVRVELP